MTAEMIFGVLFGVGLLVVYIALGVFCAKIAWRWSAGLARRWVRVLLVSAVVTLFFMPGVVGGGHGAGVGPAWLMFATGTFQALTAASKKITIISIFVTWAVVFAVGLLISRRRTDK